MDNLPIMFFHRGNQGYLRKVIEQAEKWNTEVWLLGDESNKTVTSNWVDSSKLESELFEQFLENYEHMSTRPYETELVCFESHFRYYELAKKMGWQKFLTMDSDVLVYRTFTEKMFSDVEAAFGWTEPEEGQSENDCDPFVTFWTMDAMDEYIHFCVEEYKDKKAELQKKWNYHVNHRINGGVCDMTLLTMWKRTTTRRIGNVAHEKNGEVFDVSVAASHNEYTKEYRVSQLRKLKKIRFKGDVPYLQKLDGRWVRANVLHCMGHNKKCIKYLQICSNFALPYICINWISAFKITVKHTLRRWHIVQ